MRENTKIILWVVVITFVITIFAVWGLDLRTGKDRSDPNVIGRVNGVPITRAQYQSAVEALSRQFRQASNEPLNYSQEQFVASQAWDNIVYSILTDEQIEKLGITVSDAEILSYLRTTPPPEIQQYFLDDKGNFDEKAYQAALNNPEIDWTNLEDLARQRIPRLKLQNYLTAQVFVTEDEVRLAYAMETTELKIAYVEFPIDEADAKGYSPSQEEIDKYYNSHRQEFTEPAKARVDVVSFELKPSEQDLQDAAFTAQRVYDQIAAGEDFGALAKTYSEAATSHVEGGTGFIKRGQRDDAYFNALDALEPGAVSQPVKMPDGYYILKLLETKTEQGQKEYNAQEILVKSTVSRTTVDSLYSVASSFRERAKQAGLDVAASERTYTMLTPDAFTEGAPIGTLGFVPSINEFAFANEVGTLSGELRDETHIYVARVVDRVPEGVRPLGDVTVSIRERLVLEAKKTATLRDAKAFYTKAIASSFDEAVATYSRTVKEPAPFKAVDNAEGLGPNSTVAQAALATDQGRVAPPVESRRSVVVLRVIQKTPFDDADYRSKASRIRDMLEARKMQAYTAYWYEKMRENSVVEDLRNKVY